VDKDGSEWYQVTIGGKQGNDASIGTVIGPSFAAEEMPGVIQRLIDVYIQERTPEELFIDTVRRLGIAPFKAHVYADKNLGAKEVAKSSNSEAAHV
jgi:sulfite reductase (NADPH) hemoprotein beta-component